MKRVLCFLFVSLSHTIFASSSSIESDFDKTKDFIEAHSFESQGVIIRVEWNSQNPYIYWVQDGNWPRGISWECTYKNVEENLGEGEIIEFSVTSKDEAYSVLHFLRTNMNENPYSELYYHIEFELFNLQALGFNQVSVSPEGFYITKTCKLHKNGHFFRCNLNQHEVCLECIKNEEIELLSSITQCAFCMAIITAFRNI